MVCNTGEKVGIVPVWELDPTKKGKAALEGDCRGGEEEKMKQRSPPKQGARDKETMNVKLRKAGSTRPAPRVPIRYKGKRKSRGPERITGSKYRRSFFGAKGNEGD